MSDVASSRPSPDEPSDRALDPGAAGGHAAWAADPRGDEPWRAEPWTTDPWQIGAGQVTPGQDGDAYATDPLADVIADLADLADPERSGFINGAALSVDGGWAADGSWQSLRLDSRGR